MNNEILPTAYRLHVQDMDEQHAELFRMIQLIDSGRMQFTDALRALQAYAQEHFADEEKYFGVLTEHEAEEHRLQHAAFEQHVALITRELSKSPTLARSLRVYLTRWLRGHVLVYDKKLAEAYRAQKQSE